MPRSEMLLTSSTATATMVASAVVLVMEHCGREVSGTTISDKRRGLLFSSAVHANFAVKPCSQAYNDEDVMHVMQEKRYPVILHFINGPVHKSPQDLGAVVRVQQNVVSCPAVAQLQAIQLDAQSPTVKTGSFDIMLIP